MKFNLRRSRSASFAVALLIASWSVAAKSAAILANAENTRSIRELSNSLVNLQIEVIKSLPFAMALNSTDAILNIIPQIVSNMDERLDIPLLELSEFDFGAATREHEDGAINRGFRMIKKIDLRLRRGGAACQEHSIKARKFVNDSIAGHPFRCGDARTVKETRRVFIETIRRHNGKPSPHTWPHILVSSDYTNAQREKAISSRHRDIVIELPRIQASYIRSKGREGWPAWFRIGAFTEVLAREPHPSMDGLLLELRDFSLGKNADASMQRALLYRLEHFPRFAALAQARLTEAPTWLGYPLVVGDQKRVYPTNPSSPVFQLAVESLNRYGVRALTQAERNAELKKVLALHATRR